jgi:hypothetical protein
MLQQDLRASKNQDSSCAVEAPVLTSTGALDPPITIARSHMPSLSHLSTVSPTITGAVAVAIYRAAHVENNSDCGRGPIRDGGCRS